MKTKSVLSALGLLLVILLTPDLAVAKEATVTLEISGMT